MPPLRRLAAFLLCALLGLPAGLPRAQAQASEERLQSPQEFLGYELGTRFTPPHRAAAYARHVAAASPHARLTRYGTTPEGRPLQLLTITAPQNVERLGGIRSHHMQPTGLLEAGAEPIPLEEDERGKAIVWLSYNIHGDEASSTEAAMRTLHALADPQNEEMGPTLQNAVVLLDPQVNPDGRARYVQWYRQTRGTPPNARPVAREHSPPWPGGRTNHYLFDLNRDWAWATQPETRARLDAYHRWMPHVHVDFHEMGTGDPYYFAPGAEPMHEALTPFQEDFQETVGRANAEVFDRQGWLYFTGEVYDLFYPGYGDTWPLFNGAVGMTYEQGGGGRAGLLIQTATDSLSLKERIAHHHATALQTVETAARERRRLTDAFADYYRSARDGLEGETAAYVVSGRNEDRRRALVRLLERQRIRYEFAAENGEARGTSYATGEEERFQIESGDLIVRTAQPKARLAKGLFERQPALSDSLTYDITAWALPFAFGMGAHATSERPDVETDESQPGRRQGPIPAPPAADEADPYAYLAEWRSLRDARLLGKLLKQDVNVRFARESFEAGGRRWGRGTLVVTRADNEHLGARFNRAVEGAAGRQPLMPIESGLTPGGPDLGSDNVGVLEQPQVGVLSGPGLSPTAVGEVWHVFEKRLRYPATLMRAEDLRASDLDGFDVLVMPSGDYGAVFPEGERAWLRKWVEGGGRLVAMGEAAGFLAGVDGFGAERKETEDPAPRDSLGRYAQREREAASGRVPGAIFRAALDATHPLGYGYAQAGGSGDGRETYYTLRRGAGALAPLTDGWNVATLPAAEEGAPVSGFAGTQAQRRLAGSLVFGVEPVGTGRAVYLADDPLFRGFWQGGMLLFSNAVFMVGQ